MKELPTTYKPLKQEDDGPMPKKKIELIAKYKEQQDRPPPTLETLGVNVMLFLKQESNGDDDIIEDLDNKIITEAVKQ